MLSSSPASTTQIVAVAGAVLSIVGLGSAEVADRLLGWMGFDVQRTSKTAVANSEDGEIEAEQDSKG